MRHLILALYILIFATGFSGVAALFVLRLRVRSGVLALLEGIQLLYLGGLGLVAASFYLDSILGGRGGGFQGALAYLSLAVNAGLYLLALLLIRRLEGAGGRGARSSRAAQVLAGLVILKTGVNALLVPVAGAGSAVAESLLASEAWNLGGYLLTGLALASFGVVMRRGSEGREEAIVDRLLRGYALCAFCFAPLGFLEYLLNELRLPLPGPLSLDYLFYLGWNLVSLSAARAAFSKREEGGRPAQDSLLDSVPPELARELGLTARESEMALLIARGLSNKEIAAELGISPATVRTHIYNLFQKAGARSRIELLKRLAAPPGL